MVEVSELLGLLAYGCGFLGGFWTGLMVVVECCSVRTSMFSLTSSGEPADVFPGVFPFARGNRGDSENCIKGFSKIV